MKKYLFILICTFALAPFAYASVQLGSANSTSLSSGLVGYWPLDGNTTNWATGIAKDISGSANGSLGLMSTTTAPMLGKIAQALRFKFGSYLTTNASDVSAPCTVTAWVYLQNNSSTSHGYPIVDSGTYSVRAQQFGATTVGETTYAVADDTFSPSYTVPAGQWTFLAFVNGVGTATLYANGVMRGTIARTIACPRAFVGGNSVDNFSGGLDDVRIYNRALSASDVAQLYGLGGVTMSAKSSSGGGLSGSVTANWSFDSSTVSGTSVSDLSGNNHTLTLVNGASITNGYNGQALTLDGTNQYAYGLIGSLPTSVSLSMWVKANDVSTEQSVLTEEGDGAPSSGYHFTLVGIYNNAFYAGFWDIGDIASSPIVAGQWYHVILTYDGVANTQSLYLDGVLQGTQSGTWSPPSDIYFLAGYQQSGCSFTSASGHCGDLAHYFNGQIDDLKGYDQAFSQQDVSNIYNGSAKVYIAQPSTALAKGLVGYWPLDGNTTNWRTDTAADLSGQGNTGQMISMSTTTSPVIGKIGQALNFNGSTQYVTIPRSASLEPAGALSFGGWFKTYDKTQDQRVISKTESGGYQISLNENSVCPAATLCALVYAGGAYVKASYATSNLSNNVWYHVFATYDGATLRLYVNGAQVATGSGSGALAYGTNIRACIGSEPGSVGCGAASFFKGLIDDVRVYNRALSAGEVNQLYGIGK